MRLILGETNGVIDVPTYGQALEVRLQGNLPKHSKRIAATANDPWPHNLTSLPGLNQRIPTRCVVEKESEW